MKRLLLFLLLVSPVCAQQPVAKRSFLAQIPGRYFHNLKASFTDLKHDKKWLIYSIVADTAQLLDTSTSSRGMSMGYRDGFAGHSQAKLWAGTLAIHFLGMQPMAHAMGEDLQTVCENDNLQPEEWKHVADPKSCRYAYWIGLPAAGIHVHNAITNLQRPDLAHVAIIHRSTP